MLRVISNGLRQRGVVLPNVNRGSDDYIWAQAVGNEDEAFYANMAIAADQLMPDTSIGDDLARILAIYGLAFRSAGASTGNIIFSTTLPTSVPSGAQLQDANGNRFMAPVGGTYANGASIAVRSVGVGSSTNLAGGSTLTWVTPPTYAASTAALDPRGTFGGVDKENDDTARQRLLAILASPAGSGNATQLASAAETADASVQKAFVYPACNGPGTVHIAVAGLATASLPRSRAVSAAAVANAASTTQGALPEYAELVVTGTIDQTADVSMVLRLPAATTAIPAGTGGGFLDAQPFPSVTGILATRIYARATAVTTSTSLTIESMAAPLVGQSVSWVDRNYFVLHTAKILTASTTTAPAGTAPGTYAVTVDTPFVDQGGAAIVANDYVFPTSLNGTNYLAAMLAQFAVLGPYEKTLAGGLLPHAYRQPRSFVSWDYQLGDAFLRALSNAGQEVQSVTWGYQNGGVVVPALPATISTGPSVFIPLRVAFYSP